MTSIPLQQLDSDLPVPRAMRAGDAAVDLPARIDVTLGPGDRVLVPTGFAIAIPFGSAGLVLSRSGLALQGISVANSPGLIDSGYRGEIKVILANHTAEPVSVTRGQRIAQLMVIPVPALVFDVVDELPAAHDDRGDQGFGSSGV